MTLGNPDYFDYFDAHHAVAEAQTLIMGSTSWATPVLGNCGRRSPAKLIEALQEIKDDLWFAFEALGEARTRQS